MTLYSDRELLGFNFAILQWPMQGLQLFVGPGAGQSGILGGAGWRPNLTSAGLFLSELKKTQHANLIYPHNIASNSGLQ